VGAAIAISERTEVMGCSGPRPQRRLQIVQRLENAQKHGDERLKLLHLLVSAPQNPPHC
jgi:hypothetical protein